MPELDELLLRGLEELDFKGLDDSEEELELFNGLEELLCELKLLEELELLRGLDELDNEELALDFNGLEELLFEEADDAELTDDEELELLDGEELELLEGEDSEEAEL
jgi:hypothetical protein